MICNVEVWKVIDNYPDYEVSNKGRVRSWKKFGPGGGRRDEPRMLKTVDNGAGYKKVILSSTEGKRQFYVHQLVLTVFAGKRPNGMQCCHNDGNPKNNAIDNLRWDTCKHNQADRKKHGTYLCGEKIHSAKLTDKDVLAIANDKRPQRVIAAQYGVHQSLVSCIRTGKAWPHLTGIKYQSKRRKVNV